MTETTGSHAVAVGKGQERVAALMEKLLAAAQPGAVYSEPVTSGDYTVITAAEVSAGGGFGSGIGYGGAPAAASERIDGAASETGGGGGAAGGGGSWARPVAAIVIGPAGVEVQPIFDITKLGVAALTALGTMFVMLRKMRQR